MNALQAAMERAREREQADELDAEPLGDILTRWMTNSGGERPAPAVKSRNTPERGVSRRIETVGRCA